MIERAWDSGTNVELKFGQVSVVHARGYFPLANALFYFGFELSDILDGYHLAAITFFL